MTVYRITGEGDLVPAAEVTVKDLLRLLVEEEATHAQAPAATRNALLDITRKPQNTIAVAATWPTNAFRASVVNCNRLHAAEMSYFWRCISEDDLADFMWRLSKNMIPGTSQRVRDKSKEMFHVHQMIAAKKHFSVVSAEPP